MPCFSFMQSVIYAINTQLIIGLHPVSFFAPEPSYAKNKTR